MNEAVFNAVADALENDPDKKEALQSYNQMVARVYKVLLQGELKEAIVDFRPFVDLGDVQSAAESIVADYMETK